MIYSVDSAIQRLNNRGLAAVAFFPHKRKSKSVLDSGLHAVVSGFLTGFQSLSVEFGIPIVSRIPDSTRKSFPDNPESEFLTYGNL